MDNLNNACKDALKNGNVQEVAGNAIFVGKTTKSKVASIERSYSKAFYQRWQKRVAKEQKAGKELHDFVITY